MSTVALMPSRNPLPHYFSRRKSSRIRTNDLPFEKGARGMFTPSGIFFASVKLLVPLAYLYILLVLLRELSENFPNSFAKGVERYLPYLALVLRAMRKSSLFMETWAVIEAIFFICLKLKIRWLQSKDTLEASLSAAPMLELEERAELWAKMMKSEMKDPVAFLRGWFFDEKLENITKFDLVDFIAWSMFEGRHQEHLTHTEVDQLNEMVDEIEWRISIHMFGFDRPSSHGSESNNSGYSSSDTESYKNIMRSPISEETDVDGPSQINCPLSELHWSAQEGDRALPNQWFRFTESSLSEESTFFSSLYENYKRKYEAYRDMLGNAHPVEDMKHFVAEKLVKIEEHAMAAAYQTYERAYYQAVSKGGEIDKRITAFGHARQAQLVEAWERMCSMKELLVFSHATSIVDRRKALQQQLKGYKILLGRMRSTSSAVPSKHMAGVMRKITQCHEAMEHLEASAKDAFVKASGFARESLNPFVLSEPKRYAKYSSDPLLGLTTYPLAFHILLLLLTDGRLRVLMKMRGFEKRRLGPISYYYHPGNVNGNDNGADQEIPIVFCHGIGIGLIVYLPLVDGFIKTGRPIFLPEIPYVSGFRPWQSPHSILPPASVTSTLTAMLASHGYLRAMFAGHSYGTSWVSYMCKYAPSVTTAIMFLDPICFCLHSSCLTRHFVYHRTDPGSVSYMIRTDMMINWTIQRSFPWAAISLFTEQIPPEIPYSVFLSAQDVLVPSENVEMYLRSKGASVVNFEEADESHFLSPMAVTKFSDCGHGDWVQAPSMMARIAEAAELLCSQIDEEKKAQ